MLSIALLFQYFWKMIANLSGPLIIQQSAPDSIDHSLPSQEIHHLPLVFCHHIIPWVTKDALFKSDDFVSGILPYDTNASGVMFNMKGLDQDAGLCMWMEQVRHDALLNPKQEWMRWRSEWIRLEYTSDRVFQRDRRIVQVTPNWLYFGEPSYEATVCIIGKIKISLKKGFDIVHQVELSVGHVFMVENNGAFDNYVVSTEDSSVYVNFITLMPRD